MRVAKKYSQVFFVFLVTLAMSFLMSLALTAINMGFPSDFVFQWLRAWGLSFPIAFIAAFLILPPIRRLVERLTDSVKQN